MIKIDIFYARITFFVVKCNLMLEFGVLMALVSCGLGLTYRKNVVVRVNAPPVAVRFNNFAEKEGPKNGNSGRWRVVHSHKNVLWSLADHFL